MGQRLPLPTKVLAEAEVSDLSLAFF
jgi:hypothetical protein